MAASDLIVLGELKVGANTMGLVVVLAEEGANFSYLELRSGYLPNTENTLNPSGCALSKNWGLESYQGDSAKSPNDLNQSDQNKGSGISGLETSWRTRKR